MKLVRNYINGRRIVTQQIRTIINPLDGKDLFNVCDTSRSELAVYLEEFKKTPEYGLHNPHYRRERYMLYGSISRKLANMFDDKTVYDNLFKLIQSCVPKSDSQVASEILVTKRFLENFSGDQVRFMARGVVTSGDHAGQQSTDYWYPYGKVAIITPFNYPLEIPVLQLMGALFMGNRPMLHVDIKVSQVMDYFIDLLLEAGMPQEDLLFINGCGKVINDFLLASQPRNTLFTGSTHIAEKLLTDLMGRVKIEDGGFDWKIIDNIGYHELFDVIKQCDIDAYEFGGQKCSAQSIMFLNRDTMYRTDLDFIYRLEALAKRRSLHNLTNVPLLSVSNQTIDKHIYELQKINGSRVVFGGKSIQNTSIPERYGIYEPTLIYIPLENIKNADETTFNTITKEIFGPVQIVTDYVNIDDVISCINRMKHKLTAGIVSDDSRFIDYVLGRTVNGTTYTGIKARTTGAPQNHWFGPGADPRGGSLGTPEAIRHVWGYHRVVTSDIGSYE